MALLDVVKILAESLPAWHLDAECRNADPTIFFPNGSSDNVESHQSPQNRFSRSSGAWTA